MIMLIEWCADNGFEVVFTPGVSSYSRFVRVAFYHYGGKPLCDFKIVRLLDLDMLRKSVIDDVCAFDELISNVDSEWKKHLKESEGEK